MNWAVIVRKYFRDLSCISWFYFPAQRKLETQAKLLIDFNKKMGILYFVSPMDLQSLPPYPAKHIDEKSHSAANQRT
jgi:hypothetical protein